MAIQLQGDNISTVSSDLTVGGTLTASGNAAVTGTSTFTGYTTHASGISVAGTITCSNEGRIGVSPTITTATKLEPDGGFYLYKASLASNTSASGITGYLVSSKLGSNRGANDVEVVGFRSNLRADETNNNIYSLFFGNSAPSYFGGLTEHRGGVSVTGNMSATDGIDYVAGRSLNIISNGNRVVKFNPNDSWNMTVEPVIPAGTTGTTGYGLVYSPDLSGNFSTQVFGIRQQPSISNLTTPRYVFNNLAITATAPTNIQNIEGYSVDNTITKGTVSNKGFASNLAVDGDKNYNFYAAGTAPNYFNGGIQFDLTGSPTATGLLLEDYEEGDWVPTLFGQNIAGTPTYAASTEGRYTRVGNVVNCWGKIVLTSAGGINGNVRLGGLPFTSSKNSNARGAVTISYAVNFTGSRPVSGNVQQNNTFCLLLTGSNSDETTNFTSGNLTDTSELRFQICYPVL